MRLIIAGVLALTSMAAQAIELNLVAIMGDKAMVEVDGGRPKLLAPGQSAGGAKLVSVINGAVVFDIDGQKKTLTMDNRAIKSNGGDAKPGAGPVKTIILPMDASGHFFAQLSFNGMPVKGLIDTGATSLAISSSLAKAAGIDYSRGEGGYAQTAQGVVPYRRVKVATLKFVDVVLYNVDATVLEGQFPMQPLIGMNILERFIMQREADRLTLTQRY